MESSNSSRRDISIPEEYKDFTEIIKNRSTIKFIRYLVDTACPISGAFKNTITITNTSTENVKKTLDNIFNYCKTASDLFNGIPVYTISYLSALLTCVRSDTELIKETLVFLHSFIKPEMNPEYLEILIPTIFFNIASEDPPLRVPFIFFLAETYDPNTILEYLLIFLFSLKNHHFVITRLHLSVLTNLVERYSVDEEKLHRCKEFAKYVQENETSSPELQTLITTLDQCDLNDGFSPSKKSPSIYDYERSFHSYRKQNINISVSSPDIKMRRQSLISPSSPIGQDLLNELLDKIENKMYSNPIDLLNSVRSQLDHLRSFPDNRSIEPLFELAFRTQASKNTTIEERRQIFLLMSPINSFCDPYKLLKLYIAFSQNQHKVFNRDFLEQCYQHFTSIARHSGKLKNVEIPNSLALTDSETPEEKVEFAFTCLSKWDTSYDGVNRIWEILKSRLSINSDVGNDIYDHYDQLKVVQKHFLVAGLRVHMESAVENGDADEFDNNAMEAVLEILEDQMSNESNSDRINRNVNALQEKFEQIITDKNVTPQTEDIQKIDVNLSNLTKLSSAHHISSSQSATRLGRRDSDASNSSTASTTTPTKRRIVDNTTTPKSIMKKTTTPNRNDPMFSAERRRTPASKLKK